MGIVSSHKLTHCMPVRSHFRSTAAESPKIQDAEILDERRADCVLDDPIAKRALELLLKQMALMLIERSWLEWVGSRALCRCDAGG